MTGIQEKLFALQDLGYREFHAKLMPTVAKDLVIGVRTPQIRKLAKDLAKTPEGADFLNQLPHTYYEENNLHGALLSLEKDYAAVIRGLDEFLPYVDNWATCDLMRPKAFQKHRPQLLEKIPEWLASEHPYTVRFAMEMLMAHYLDEDFQPAYLDWVAQVRREEYYVKMMAAWYFATALAKQWEAALPYLREKRLETWTHNKAIQKAVESYRITPQQKEYLRTLKQK